MKQLNRRELLAGAGVVAAASVGGLTIVTGKAKAFPRSRDVESAVPLHLDWRETYNGNVVEDSRTGDRTGSPNSPLVSLGDVLPGDRGTLSVRIALSDTGSGATAAVPYLSLDLIGRAENGIDEPERVAGDDTPSTGELQNFLDVALWYDTGLAGIDAFGGRNARRDVGETLVHPDAKGTLAAVAEALPDAVRLDPSGSTPGRNRCLDPGHSVIVTLGWRFDAGTRPINVTQSDSVTFGLEFRGERCETRDVGTDI